MPTVEVAGYYRVYALWLEHSNRSEQVAFDIIHSDGSDTVTVDQRTAGRQWNELGVYYFQAGSGYFEVSDRNGLYAVADAVKLEYVSH